VTFQMMRQHGLEKNDPCSMCTWVDVMVAHEMTANSSVTDQKNVFNSQQTRVPTGSCE